MGHNGCGKSTLLKIIGGLLDPSGGTIKRHGDVRISYMPDKLPLAPFTVRAYLSHMGRIQKLGHSGRKSDHSGRKSDQAELTEHMERFFSALALPERILDAQLSNCSKGTLQKINIIQGFMGMGDTDVLLMDEPFSGLDEAAANTLETLMLQLVTQGKCVVTALHDRQLAQRLSTDIHSFQQGRLLPTLPPSPSEPTVKLEVRLACETHIEMLRPLTLSAHVVGSSVHLVVPKSGLNVLLSELIAREAEIVTLKPTKSEALHASTH